MIKTAGSRTHKEKESNFATGANGMRRGERIKLPNIRLKEYSRD